MADSSGNRRAGSRFRDYIIQKLAFTSFMIHEGDTDEELASRLGIRVDVLHEAREVFQKRMEEVGLKDQELGRRISLSYFQPGKREVHLEPPPLVYTDWEERCVAQQLDSSVMFRSIVHLVLKSTTQPGWLERKKGTAAWVYRGQWIKHENIRDRRNRINRCRLTATISEGAHCALRVRAERTRISYSALARWGVCLMVNDQLPAVEIVHAAHAMYKRAEDYCLNPQIT